uniref:Uncharacterized protein n=1 Tax=Rhizophagus irregularis (strain DAOM 181602 / DAOM 197198 / MUCL 43194) TaxID=747089 RepID=U9T7K4_RHIID
MNKLRVNFRRVTESVRLLIIDIFSPLITTWLWKDRTQKVNNFILLEVILNIVNDSLCFLNIEESKHNCSYSTFLLISAVFGVNKFDVLKFAECLSVKSGLILCRITTRGEKIHSKEKLTTGKVIHVKGKNHVWGYDHVLQQFCLIVIGITVDDFFDHVFVPIVKGSNNLLITTL